MAATAATFIISNTRAIFQNTESNTMSFIDSIRQFKALVWVIIFGTFLTRTTFFMVWPFLAIILYEKFALSPAHIGLILSLSGASGTVLGFWVGHLSDRIGRKKIMLVGVGINIAGFALLAGADSVSIYTTAVILVGTARAFLEAPGKALISDALPDRAAREMAFHLRYFMLNVGAAVGPLAGLTLGLTAQQPTFWITSFTYLLFGFGLMAAFKRFSSAKKTSLSVERFGDTLKILQSDKAFLALIIANLFIMLTYSQIDATLVQYIQMLQFADAKVLYTWLITTNAITIVVCQFPILRLIQHLALHVRVIMGVSLFGITFSAFSVIPADMMWLWIANMAVLSVGETILFPTLNIQIDRMAPSHLKGSYFGAAALAGFGFSLGPLVGGILLGVFQSGIIWWFFGVTQIGVIILYLRAVNMRRPFFETQEQG